MKSRELYLRLLRYLKPYLNGFILAVLCIALFALTEPILPALMQPLLDGSFVNNTEETKWFIPVVISILFMVRGLLFFASKYLLAWTAQGVVRDLRNELFAKITNLPAHFFNHNPAGKLISKVTYDISQVSEAATDTLIILIRDTLTILGLVVFLVYTSWKMSLFILIIFPVVAVIINYISKRLRRLSHSAQDDMGQVTHVLEEAINGHKIIKIFAGQKYEQNRFAESSNSLRKFFIKTASTAAASISIIQLFNAMAVSCVIYFALSQAHNGSLTVGQFVSFLGGLALLWPSVKRLTQVNEKLQRGLAAADSVFSFADEPVELETGSKEIIVKEGGIECHNLRFRYPNTEKEVLRDLSINILPKRAIAIVGESGTGKSSLVQLIPRIYNPDSGYIKIDGQDIKDVTLKSLRENVSYVDQNITLFNDTVANNIAYGSLEDAPRAAIIQAAKDASAYQFIENLPQGFDTLIGNNGALLSGGQRQRIAIARALLKPAPILILDEGTSALDQSLEKTIQKTITSLRSSRTIIIITHRLSAVTHVDKIYLFADGVIKESGTHSELIKSSTAYQKLFSTSDISNEDI